MNCKCSKSEVCKCAIYEDDLNWAKALGIVVLCLFLALYVLPRGYHWVTDDTPTVVTPAEPGEKLMSKGEVLQFSGYGEYVVIKPFNLDRKLKVVSHNVGKLRDFLVEEQYIMVVQKP